MIDHVGAFCTHFSSWCSQATPSILIVHLCALLIFLAHFIDIVNEQQASLAKLQAFRFEHRIMQERQRELEVRRMQHVVHAQLLDRRATSEERMAGGKTKNDDNSSSGNKVSEAYEWFVDVQNIWNGSAEVNLASFENNFADLNATFVQTGDLNSTLGSAFEDARRDTGRGSSDDSIFERRRSTQSA
jgi:hypothetical protein